MGLYLTARRLYSEASRTLCRKTHLGFVLHANHTRKSASIGLVGRILYLGIHSHNILNQSAYLFLEVRAQAVRHLVQRSNNYLRERHFCY